MKTKFGLPVWVLSFSVSLALACIEPPKRPWELPYWAQPKNRFQDEWWMQRTVTAVPYSIDKTYVGEGDFNDRILWKVEEKHLVAYRARPFVQGKHPDVAQVNAEETPLAMYPIRRHFDVVNGQIVDYPLRPWFEKSWMDVDWSNDQTRSFRFPPLTFAQTAAPYFISRPDDPDFPIFTDDYVDFTTHLTLSPTETVDPEGQRPNFCQSIAPSIDIRDCSAMDLTYRTSIRKVPKNRAYQPLRFVDLKTSYEKSWFFRFWRGGGTYWIDNQYGLTDQGLELVTNRFNLWQTTEDDNGNLLPVRQRQLRLIPFHVSLNFPEDLWDEAQYAFDAWNKPFTETVAELRYWECIDEGSSEAACAALRVPPAKVLVLCHNPVRDGDEEVCGEKGSSARLGDVRYNFLSWINSPQVFRPIGLAWWSVDMHTGEIISANAKLYGSGLDWSAANARDAVLLATGRIKPTEVLYQTYMNDWLSYLQNHDRSTSSREGLTASYLPGNSTYVPKAPPPASSTLPAGSASSTRGLLSWEQAMTPLVGHALESVAMEPDAYLMKGLSPQEATPESLARSSWIRHPLSGAEEALTKVERDAIALEGDLQLPADLYLVDLIKEFGTQSPEAIYQEIRSRFARAAFLHELGHVLGLRHNFSGSFDAVNFKEEYWKLRNDGNVGPRYVDPPSVAEKEGNIEQYAYASVMDYHPSPNQFLHGLGHYDIAAIKMLYGQMVEFLPAATPESKQLLYALHRRSSVSYATLNAVADSAHPDGVRLTGIHPSRYGQILGNLSHRKTAPAWHLSNDLRLKNQKEDWMAVPHLACAEEQNSFPFCSVYDQGVDPYETISNGISWFQTWYPLNNFRRSRLTFTPHDYKDSVWKRTFGPIKSWQQFLYAYQVDVGSRQAQVFADSQAFEPLVVGVNEGFNFLARTLAMPEPGPYVQNTLPDGQTLLQSPFLESPSFTYGGIPVDLSNVAVSLTFPEARYYQSAFGLGATRAFNVEVIGSAVDKQLAMETLLNPQFFQFPGSDTWPNPRYFMVNFFQNYPTPLLDVMGALIAGDADRLAPRYDGTGVYFRDYSNVASSVPGVAIDPSTPFSLRIRALMYGLTLMYSGYADRRFLDSARVYVLGNGDAIDSSRPQVDFLDVASGKTFRAYSFIENGLETGIGARMVKKAKRLSDAAAGLGGENAQVRARAATLLRDEIDLLEMTRTLTRDLDWARFGGTKG